MQGAEVCHQDRIILNQAWLCLASDRPSDACLKQCGSVDEFCDRQDQRSKAKAHRGSHKCVATGGSVKARVGGKSVFSVRPECAWTIQGVEVSGSGKKQSGGSGSGNAGGSGGAGGGRTSSATLLEGAATRQLQR